MSNQVLVWVDSFLRFRTMRVSVEGVTGRSCDVLSGVPQGSVLGRVFFLFMSML